MFLLRGSCLLRRITLGILAAVRTEAYFTVFGEPAPQGSKRYVGGNAASGGRFIEASKKLEPWRQAVAAAVKLMFEATVDDTPFEPHVPLEVWVTFVMPKPSTVKRLFPTVAPDLDKLCRGLGDSMSLERYALLIPDDAQIVRWHAEKVYGSRAEMGARVAVRLLDENNGLITSN